MDEFDSMEVKSKLDAHTSAQLATNNLLREQNARIEEQTDSIRQQTAMLAREQQRVRAREQTQRDLGELVLKWESLKADSANQARPANVMAIEALSLFGVAESIDRDYIADSDDIVALEKIKTSLQGVMQQAEPNVVEDYLKINEWRTAADDYGLLAAHIRALSQLNLSKMKVEGHSETLRNAANNLNLKFSPLMDRCFTISVVAILVLLVADIVHEGFAGAHYFAILLLFLVVWFVIGAVDALLKKAPKARLIERANRATYQKDIVSYIKQNYPNWNSEGNPYVLAKAILENKLYAAQEPSQLEEAANSYMEKAVNAYRRAVGEEPDWILVYKVKEALLAPVDPNEVVRICDAQYSEFACAR